MPNVDPDFDRSCTRINLSEQHSRIFTPREPVLDFSEADLRRFNDCVACVAPGTPPLDAAQIAGAARRLWRVVGAGRASRFIQTRMRRVGEIRALLADPGWSCDAPLRERMQALLAYMDTGPGLVPDFTQIIGGLDDALLVDLAMEGLRDELDEYADFCRCRLGEAARLGIAPAAVAFDQAGWRQERAEELRIERQLRRARGTPYANKGADPGVFRVG